MKDNLVYLEHILESIEVIEEHIVGIEDDEDFASDVKSSDAVVRRLEIIGEAASNISSDFRQKYDLVKWRKIIDTRNLLIHGYFGVNYSQVWNIVKLHIPELKQQIINIINDLKK